MSLPFEGSFKAGVKYLLKGSTIHTWLVSYTADRVLPGRGIQVTGTPLGRIFNVEAPGEASTCILGTLTPDPDTPDAFIINSGNIKGGGKTLDLIKKGIVPIANGDLFVEIGWTANGEDGVILGGGTMTTADITTAASMPADTIPDGENLNGTARIKLGRWDEDAVFTPHGCGSLGIKFCPGEFTDWRR